MHRIQELWQDRVGEELLKIRNQNMYKQQEDSAHNESNVQVDDSIETHTKIYSSINEEVKHNKNSSENLTDELFLPLVSALSVYSGHVEGEGDQDKSKYVVLFKPDSDRENEWIEISRADRSLPGLIVFQAIASKFPEFGNTSELVAKYRDLVEQKTKPNLAADMCVSADQALHSYRNQLCRQCFLYCCSDHTDPDQEDTVPKLEEQEELTLSSTPCGLDCFLRLHGSLATLSTCTPAKSTDSQSIVPLLRPELCDELNSMWGITNTERNVWTCAEETLYRELACSFPNNWCVIAQTMVTKRCSQVYQFSLQDPDTCVKHSTSCGEQSRGSKFTTGSADVGECSTAVVKVEGATVDNSTEAKSGEDGCVTTTPEVPMETEAAPSTVEAAESQV